MAISNVSEEFPDTYRVGETMGKNFSVMEQRMAGVCMLKSEIPELTDYSSETSEEEECRDAGAVHSPQLAVSKQVSRKLIIRVVCNSLITKFPVDECCNDKNNLMINNLVKFIEKVLHRSHVTMRQFLVSSIYLFRLQKRPFFQTFRNNRSRLCLRRLMISGLILASGATNFDFWSQVCGLSATELKTGVVRFGKELGSFEVSEMELTDFCSRLNDMVKLLVKIGAV